MTNQRGQITECKRLRVVGHESDGKPGFGLRQVLACSMEEGSYGHGASPDRVSSVMFNAAETEHEPNR